MSGSGSVEFVCGGCGRRQAGAFNRSGDACKPPEWFIRTDEDGTQLACSRECIGKVSQKSGKHSLVAPW